MRHAPAQVACPISNDAADRLFFISLSMTVGAFVAAFQWDALFPTRRDYLILRPLPVTLRQIFFARLLSVVLLAVMFVLAVNVVVAFTFPTVSAGRWQQPPRRPQTRRRRIRWRGTRGWRRRSA